MGALDTVTVVQQTPVPMPVPTPAGPEPLQPPPANHVYKTVRSGPAPGLLRFDNMVKSEQDDRLYRCLQLENGLKVYLISDPATEKAAAALSVGVGHMSDPEHLPGLAHFCEHMLFLGTRKYPDENAYSAFLNEHGGSSNAATYADTTKYYFDVIPGQLDGALDRFAQFFIGPLFTENMTEREINAVDSEHEKNIASDVWRIRQVMRSLSDPDHPYQRFGTGNKQTLFDGPASKGINIRDELIRFHERWYSSNIMSLAVYGRESLDDLQRLVIGKFAGIVDKNIEMPTWTQHPHRPVDRGTMLTVVPVKDERTVTLSFPADDLEHLYKSAPERYISHLVGHEGKGSLLSELRRRGWSNSLMCSHRAIARGFGFFDLTVDLTLDGAQHVDDIVHTAFQYLKMLRSAPPLRRVFDEYRDTSDIAYRFKDKETAVKLVSGLVHSMQAYPLEEVLTAPYLLSEWRPELIEQQLAIMTPENCRVLLVTQSAEPICRSTEPWYGTKYHLERIDEAKLRRWSQCELNPALHLPAPNPFIPANFALDKVDQLDVPTEHPTMLTDTPAMRVWHKHDTEFLKPRTIMFVDFNSPLAYSDPLNCNLTYLFVNLFRDQLVEDLYDAELSGLGSSLTNTSVGINFKITGYTDKMSVLLQQTIDRLFAFKFDSARFQIIKEQLLRSLKNYDAEQPYQHAIYYLSLIMSEHAWTKLEMIDAVALCTEDQLQQFVEAFLSRMHVECYVHGNANRQRVAQMTGIVEQKLRSTSSMQLPLLSRQLLLKREYKLNAGDRYVFETENAYHKSSCTELYVQCGQQTDRASVFVDLLAQVLTEPCYQQLRTKEQLGYIVFCGTRKANGALGLRFIVQSAKHPAVVEERIECFLDAMRDYVGKMSGDEFQRHKDALAAQKLEKPKRLGVLAARNHMEIALQTYHFGRMDSEVEILRGVSQADLLEFLSDRVLRSGAQRRTLSVHVVSTADGGAGKLDVKEPKVAEQSRIEDLARFKASKPMYPLSLPHIDVKPKGARSKL